jgi:hypothetical protein
LVSNLVSQSGFSTGVPMNPSLGGYRLRFLQQQYSPTITHSSQVYNNVSPKVEPSPPDEHEIWKEKCDRDAVQVQNSQMHFDVLRRITVLMAGAIFSVILLYLCRKLSFLSA